MALSFDAKSSSDCQRLFSYANIILLQAAVGFAFLDLA